MSRLSTKQRRARRERRLTYEIHLWLVAVRRLIAEGAPELPSFTLVVNYDGRRISS